MRKFAWSVFAVFVIVCPSVAQAVTIGPTFPAPGGTTFSTVTPAAGSGVLIDSPGRVRNYSGFTPTGNWSELFWDITDGSLDGVSFSTAGGPSLASVGVSGNKITWVPTGTWSFFDPQTSTTLSSQIQ